MAFFFRIAFDMHVVAGAIALAVLGVPLLTKKGGRVHRAVGWIYVVAAAAVSVTAFAGAGRLASLGRPGPWRNGVFLAYVALFAAESARFGVRALRAGRRGGPRRAWVDAAAPVVLVAGGLALGAFGLSLGKVLFAFFAAVGIVEGLAHLRFVFGPSPTPRDRILAHMLGMGTSCIAMLTAFVVVNARSLGMQRFDPRLWIAPIVLLAVGLTLWRRSVARGLSA